MPFTAKPYTGPLHHYAPKLVAFEHTTPGTSYLPNTLVWIGGLGDGLLTVSYANTLAGSLKSTWALAQVLLSSSYGGWGSSSVRRDADEIALFVAYVQKLRPGTSVVLMGHSTGAQDVLEYLTGEGSAARPKVQGVVLQAGISDREGLLAVLPEGVYEGSVKMCEEWVAQGRGEDVLPRSATADFFGVPVTARRWLSLMSPGKDSEDDLFSSDLPEEKVKSTFGKLKRDTPLLILYSGSDEFVPPHVDKKQLVASWTKVVKDARGAVDEDYGGIVPNATHNLEGNPENVIQDLIDRVNGFLGKVEGGELI